MAFILNILIVEDHYLMIEGYKSILAENKFNYTFNISVANNCEEAFNLVGKKNNPKYDIIFIDWSLPPYPEKNILNGGDLVPYIKHYLPFSKIAFLTSHAEGILLYDLVKKINPSGLLIKSDFTTQDFLLAINIIMEGGICYSPTVKKRIKEITSKGIYLDNYNRQIISLLSKGVKSKNLPNYPPLSMSAIDKRKAQIKDYFLIERGNDEDIITEAKKLDLI